MLKRPIDKDCPDSGAGAGKRARHSAARARHESLGHHTVETNLIIACFFTKYSTTPGQTHKCREFRLRTIADVKLHIERCHQRPLYCPICQQVFPVTSKTRNKDLDDHIRENTCVKQPEHPAPSDKLSEAEIKSLFGKQWKQAPHGPGVSEIEKKWYFAWDRLFPNTARPASIYHLESAETELLRERRRTDIDAFVNSGAFRQQVEEFAIELPGVSTDVLTNQGSRLFDRFRQFHDGDNNNNSTLSGQPLHPRATPNTPHPTLPTAIHPWDPPTTNTGLGQMETSLHVPQVPTMTSTQSPVHFDSGRIDQTQVFSAQAAFHHLGLVPDNSVSSESDLYWRFLDFEHVHMN
ncbi:hypothetical protein QBC43DRAFT_331733 [Cladorrhinum sp. PSN259]|nr:hypothetical protein QBC43DRAFT_331733 [Cladorrhinum sp. PSN259]